MFSCLTKVLAEGKGVTFKGTKIRWSGKAFREFKHRIRKLTGRSWLKVRNLLKLGTFKRTAILTGLSRKGPWRLSRTLATQSGMTNKWLKGQGLISVKELWVHIHYPTTAR